MAIDTSIYVTSYAPTPSPSTISGLGFVGDSLTEEYATTGSFNYSNNFCELLIQENGFYDLFPNELFRKFSAVTPGLNGGVFGIYFDVRGLSHKYNTGKGGCTTWAAIGHEWDGTSNTSSKQDTLMRTLVQSAEVTHLVVWLGANNFAPGTARPPTTGPFPTAIDGAFGDIYDEVWTSTEINAYNNRLYSDMDTLLTTIFDGGSPKIVLLGCPDQALSLQAVDLYPDMTKRKLVSDAVDGANDKLRQLANEYNMVFFDWLSLQRVIYGDNENGLNDTFEFGGYTIRNNTYGSSPRDATEDTIHPGSIIMGITANGVIDAFNIGYGTDITKFTDAEILAMRGVSVGEDGMGTAGQAVATYIENPAGLTSSGIVYDGLDSDAQGYNCAVTTPHHKFITRLQWLLHKNAYVAAPTVCSEDSLKQKFLDSL